MNFIKNLTREKEKKEKKKMEVDFNLTWGVKGEEKKWRDDGEERWNKT